jgi:hypothetical protein
MKAFEFGMEIVSEGFRSAQFGSTLEGIRKFASGAKVNVASVCEDPSAT